MTKEEAIHEIEKVFEPAFANYIITALTEGATSSDEEQQPKRGKWIFNENMHDYCCSECGCLMPNVNEYYRKKIIGCPYCLADMRESEEEE